MTVSLARSAQARALAPLVLLLLTSCAAGARLAHSTFPALGTTHKIDDTLIILADHVSYAGANEREIFDNAYTLENFEIDGRVYLQTCEDVTRTEDCVDVAPAKFTISIVKDRGGEICHSFIKAIFEYWQDKDSDYLANFQLLPAKVHSFYQDGEFLFYKSPDTYWPGDYWLFYGSGKLYVITLVDYDRNLGIGALQDFVTNNLRFVFGDISLRPSYKSSLSLKDFLNLTKEGMIQCPRRAGSEA